MKHTIFICIALSFSSLVAGCTTQYQPQGLSGGYSEIKMAEGFYQLVVNGNGFTTHETLAAHWHRRAKELCGGAYKGEPRPGRDTSTSLLVLPGGVFNTTDTYPKVSGGVECEKSN
jgi:hypothetical protein